MIRSPAVPRAASDIRGEIDRLALEPGVVVGKRIDPGGGFGEAGPARVQTRVNDPRIGPRAAGREMDEDRQIPQRSEQCLSVWGLQEIPEPRQFLWFCSRKREERVDFVVAKDRPSCDALPQAQHRQ
jgi:hypothetical protein